MDRVLLKRRFICLLNIMLTESSSVVERQGKALGGRWCESILSSKNFFSFFRKVYKLVNWKPSSSTA